MVVYPLLCTGSQVIQTSTYSWIEHLRKALTKCKYPKWALDKGEKRLNKPSSEAIDGVNIQGVNSTPAATREVKE